MTYLSLVSDETGYQATANVDDGIWEAHKDALEAIVAKMPGYSLVVDASPEGLYPSKNIHSLAEAFVWLHDLAITG